MADPKARSWILLHRCTMLLVADVVAALLFVKSVLLLLTHVLSGQGADFSIE